MKRAKKKSLIENKIIIVISIIAKNSKEIRIIVTKIKTIFREIRTFKMKKKKQE